MTPKRAVIAVDVGGHNVRSALVTQSGELLFRLEEKTVADRSFKGVVSQIKKFTEQSLAAAKTQKLNVQAIGISIPGYVQHEEKIVAFAPNFKDFKNVSFEKELKKYFNLPIYVENDGNCHAVGEWWKGKGQGSNHMILLVLGTGVGGGIITHGKLLRGSHGAAAELGHFLVDSNGPVCGCEARGCLESIASATAIEKKYRTSPLALELRAREGEDEAIEAYEKVGTAIGVAVASLCTIFEPEIILLGGKISKGSDLFLPAILQEAHERFKNHPSSRVKIEKAMYIDDAGLLGAACIAFEEMT